MATPKMTKSHFVLIAKTIADLDLSTVTPEGNVDDGIESKREAIAKSFANVLADTNPAFNRWTFLDACKRK